jgi:hypothetical protein
VGILSWFRSRQPSGTAGTAGEPADVEEPVDPDQPPSLIRLRYEDPGLEEVEQAAADDVARVQQDDKYFHADTPADHDEL